MSGRIYQPNAESSRTKLLYAVALIPALIAVGIAYGWLLESATVPDVRDPRCDRADRYEAMREGADCS